MSTTAAAARLTAEDVRRRKERGVPLVMVTAFDVSSAAIAERAGVDMILVGDSAAMTVLGYPSTRMATVEEMLMLTAAACRGAKDTMLVGDLPFGSYEASDEIAVATARRFAAVGCDAVKMEGAGSTIARARAVIAAGIPVMGHVGLTPQATAVGEPYRVHGRTANSARALVHDARALADAGCFAIVAEAIPAAVVRLLVPRVPVPVIAIGGGGADGQVLVLHDLLGLGDAHTPRFVRRYAELRAVAVDAVARYAADVRARRFPGAEHEYDLPPDELADFTRSLDVPS